MNTLRLILAPVLLASLTSLPAQTATWLAPGPNNHPASWHDPANWDTGVVPNSPDAVAIMPAYTLGLASLYVNNVPGTGPAVIETGDVSLGELRWQLDGSGSTQTGPRVNIGTYTSSGATTAALRLYGAGLTNVSPAAAGFQAPQVFVANGVLEFHEAASAGSLNLVGTPSNVSLYTALSTIRFKDQSTAANAIINAGHILAFDDQSTAAQSSIRMHSPGNDGGAYLGFNDDAGAGSAEIMIGGFASVTFTGSANAQAATFATDPGLSFQGGRGIYFLGESSAGEATFNLDHAISVEFRDQSSAGGATFAVADSVGVRFRDSATAAQATITGRGGVSFADTSTAGDANIVGYHVTFVDDASAGDATIAPTFDFATSSIEFHGRATAGTATLNLGKLGRVVFAGESNAGTATVAIGSGAAEGLVVVRDNARIAGLSITTAPGGHGRLDIAGASSNELEVHAVGGVTNIELGANSLAFRRSGDDPAVTLGGIISGSGGLLWDRPSILTVANAANSYSGVTLVTQGGLHLDNGRVGNTSIGSSASLTGQGQVGGYLHNAGLLSPGSSAGTIAVGGDFVQTAAGTLDIELLSPDSYDRLVVNGTASLAGRLRLFLPDEGDIVGSTSFEFLTAAAVNGQFDSVNTAGAHGAALEVQPSYSGTGVRLEVIQRPFAGFGGTTAASALGAHLDATLATATGTYREFLADLNLLATGAEVSAALAALAPDAYTTLADDSLLGALARGARQDARLAGLRDAKGRHFTVSFEAARRSTRLDALAGRPAASADADGGAAGVAWHNDGHALGLSLTQETGSNGLDGSGSQARTKVLAPAVVYQFNGDRFFFNASASSARGEHDLRRRIVYPGTDFTATGATDSTDTVLTATFGRAFRTGAWTLAPQAGLLHRRWSADDFTETGAAGANHRLSGWSDRSLYVRAGVEAAYHGGGFTPAVTVTWLHETDRSQSLHAGFAGAAGGGYVVPARNLGSSFVQARLSLEKSLGQAASFNLSVGGLWGSHARVNSDLSAGFRWEF